MSKNLIVTLPRQKAEELSADHEIEIMGEVFRPRQREWLAVEVDESEVANILGNLREDVDDLIEEVGYPGPETEFAEILENINARLSSLEDELGITD